MIEYPTQQTQNTVFSPVNETFSKLVHLYVKPYDNSQQIFKN
jgi:hypothetical protein